MKLIHTIAASLFFACLACAPLHAEPSLPASDNKAEWNRLTDMFAECSAVYNIAATFKETSAKAGVTYRELANNALIAGMYSSQMLGLGDSHLESIYSDKFNVWEAVAKDKTKSGNILGKAEQCVAESLAMQNKLLDKLRENTSSK